MSEIRSTVVRKLATEARPVVRILVLDPKQHSRAILKGFLRNLDFVHSVFERATATELVSWLAESPVHLVVLDNDLVEGSGLSVIRQVQSSTLSRKPKFLLLARHYTEEVRAEAAALGIRNVLTKPFDLNTVQQQVLEALGASTGDIQAVQSRILPLRGLPMFAGFSDRELAQVVEHCPLIRFDSGGVVFSRGQPARAMYLLVSGRIRIYAADGRPALTELEPGRCFGESALMGESSRQHGAVAAMDSWVMEVGRQAFYDGQSSGVLKMTRQIAVHWLERLYAFA